jgi:hypothetical protein
MAASVSTKKEPTMKLLKFGIRSWITIASALSFLGGWVMLVHAPKPAQLPAFVSAVPTLAPLPPLSDGVTNVQSQSIFNIQPRRRSMFKTGGS